MILNDEAIKAANIISPFDDNNLQSHSYDCTLCHFIKRPRDTTSGKWIDVDLSTSFNANCNVLHPGEFILASTREIITLPADIIGFVQGKSTIGRQGVQIENAGLIDPL